MAGGILAGFVTSFITAAVELSATLLLVSSESQAPMTYGIYLYMQSAPGRGPGAALGVLAVGRRRARHLSVAPDRRAHRPAFRRPAGRRRTAAARARRAPAAAEPERSRMKKVGLQCRNLRLSYGRTEVLKDVSLDIEPGEFFALLGPSGSGKSTLLRLIAGFDAPPVRRAADRRPRHLGRAAVAAQRRHGLSELCAVAAPDGVRTTSPSDWRNAGWVARRDQGKVAAALELVGLGAYAQRRPTQLSGGQQQRVALARTIVIEPQVLLLDEPLSNLDARRCACRCARNCCALQRRLGITTIFVTHDQEEAMTIRDRIAVLDHGVVQQVGTPMELYDEPVNALRRQLRRHDEPAARPLARPPRRPADPRGRRRRRIALRGRCRDAARRRADAELPAALAAHRGCRRCRGERRGRAAGAAGSADAALPHAHDSGWIWIPGVVGASEFVGEFTRYRVQVGAQHLTVDQPHRAGLAKFAAGAAVRLGLEPSQVRLLAA